MIAVVLKINRFHLNGSLIRTVGLFLAIAYQF